MQHQAGNARQEELPLGNARQEELPPVDADKVAHRVDKLLLFIHALHDRGSERLFNNV